MKNRNNLLNMIYSALFLALAYVMPFLTGQIPEVGAKLCPLHIPVLLCGFICGWPWGMAVGFVSPLLRSFALGMPPLFPTATAMAFELAAYGFCVGFMHRILPKKKGYIYCSLLIAMLFGRVVWGVAMYLLLGVSGGSFTLEMFTAGAFVNAIPGIIVQIVLIPPLVMLLEELKKKNFRY